MFYLDSPSGSDQHKRTPRKSKLYYRQRVERARHAAEVLALKAEIAKLSKLVTDAHAADITNDITTDGGGEVKGDDASVSAVQTATKLKAYNTLTEKMKTLPTNERVMFVQQVASPTELKEQRITSQLAKDIGLDRRALATVNRGPLLRLEKSDNRKERVLSFLVLPEYSITLAGKKDTVTVKGVKKQKVVLTQFLKTLHAEYNQLNPDKLVSLSFFSSVRRFAKFIKPLSYHSTAVCLCMQHQNYALKLRSLVSFGIPGIPDTLVQDYTKDTLKTRLDAAQLPETITFQMWKRVEVKYGDPANQKVTMKLRPVEQNMSRAEFIDVVVSEFNGMAEHVFRAKSQHKSIRTLRQQLTAEECTIQMDFAQNWNVGYSEEVQSAFYAKEAITVHPAVIHLRGEDGPVTDCVCIVSDDRQHDAGAILAIMELLTTYVKARYGLIKTVHYCSDSPSSQYRNISLFSVIAKHQELFGLKCTWAYFEAGHGKGPCDGVGAAAKRKADNALKRGININHAEDFSRVGNMEGNVTYIHMPVSASYLARKQIATLASVCKVPATMKVHAVVTLTASQKIAVRDTSCYDDCCWLDQEPKMGCSGWKEHTLFEEGNTTADDTTADITSVADNPTIDAGEPTEENNTTADITLVAENPTDDAGKPTEENTTTDTTNYCINDFVASVYDEMWYIGKIITLLQEEEYEVTFMKATNSIPPKYWWPSPEDKLTVSAEEILMVVPPPTVIGSSKRQKYHVLLPAVLAKIADKFTTF